MENSEEEERRGAEEAEAAAGAEEEAEAEEERRGAEEAEAEEERRGAEKRNRLRTALVMMTVAALLFATSSYAFGLLSRQSITSTTGVTASVDIGVYEDLSGTKNLTIIDWGIVYPGDNKTSTAYIRNLGNVDIILQMEATNWKPLTASNYMTLSWNYTGQAIKKNEVVKTTFTLAVSRDIGNIGTFNFDIVITSTSKSS